MDSGDVPTGVGRTALGAAMVRAQESRRSDRLFDDPYAAAFLAAAPGSFGSEQGHATTGGGMASWGAALSSHAVVRTRFFDDYLLGATEQGLRQVVLLAAGLDARAYRLEWPAGVQMFEFDLPEVLSFKERVLNEYAAAVRCERRTAAGDLREDWKASLVDAGFQRAEPSAWLLEGLLMYLSADNAADLLTAVHNLSAVGSRLAFEFETHGPDTLRAQAQKMPAMSEYAAMWKGGLPDAPGWLAEHRWRPEVHDGDAVSARYGRDGSEVTTGGFITAALV